jgi:hypothetical protein
MVPPATDNAMSPADAAKAMGKSRKSVLALIRTGELAATDERNPGSDRPRYRITPEAIADWRASRRVQPVEDRPEPVRRVAAGGVLARMRERRRAAAVAGK